jgi:hypothetical protein
MLEQPNGLDPQFATHNAHTVAAVWHLARRYRRPFEFQRLHGMGEELYAEVVRPDGLGVPCRVYAPVGEHEDLLPYLVRRLLENGANTSFVNRLVNENEPIGSIVADTAIKLGMNVIGFDPDITVDAAWRLSSSVRKAHTIDELLRQADFVTLHVPLLDVTRHLIGERQLAMMKPGAALLNFARAEIVDDAAVVAALDGRRLAYYLCDFPRAALLGTSRVVALPHLGASTAEAEENCAIMAVDQLRGFLEHGTIVNSVNFPSVEMARESPYRVAIANANVPTMLGQM